jgi:hypothetical protein
MFQETEMDEKEELLSVLEGVLRNYGFSPVILGFKFF